MQITLKIGKNDYRVDLENPFDISIPVSFGKKQLSAFGGAPARQHAYKAGSFVGDTRRGGSCNCGVYTFSPHLNGTHTECVGHITKKRILIQDVLKESLLPASLVTVTPGKDSLITQEMLEKNPEKTRRFLTLLSYALSRTKKTRRYATIARDLRRFLQRRR